jgi:hypothetical protein
VITAGENRTRTNALAARGPPRASPPPHGHVEPLCRTAASTRSSASHASICRQAALVDHVPKGRLLAPFYLLESTHSLPHKMAVPERIPIGTRLHILNQIPVASPFAEHTGKSADKPPWGAYPAVLQRTCRLLIQVTGRMFHKDLQTGNDNVLYRLLPRRYAREDAPRGLSQPLVFSLTCGTVSSRLPHRRLAGL